MELYRGKQAVKKFILSIALLSGFSHVASANLIANGSFEDYSIPADSTYMVATDCTGVTDGDGCITLGGTDPWQPAASAPNIFLEVRDGDLLTFGTTNVEVQDTTFGNVYAEINPLSNSGSGFQQTFKALAGTGDLSWYDYARSATPHYQVFLNDMINPIYDSSTVAPDYTQWLERSVMGVTLLGGDNVLSFVSMSTDTVSANIDNIVLTQVAAVPEPQTYLMFLAGLGLLGLAARKNRVQS